MFKPTNHQSRIQSQLSGLCQIEGEGADAGNPPAGGGGESSGGASSPPVSAPSAPAPQSDRNFNFEPSRRPAEPDHKAEAVKVRGILDKGTKPDYKLGTDEIRALLNFNPPFVEPEKKEPEAKLPAKAAPGQPADLTKPKPEAATLDPNVAALVEALKSNVTQPKAETPPTDPAKPAEQKPFYGGFKPAVEIAPELAQAIMGDDPARSAQGLNHLVNSIMNHVMQDTAQLMVAMASQLRQEIPSQTLAQVQGQSNTDRFFSKFQELNNPIYRPVVEMITNEAVAYFKSKGQPVVYDDNFLSQIGELAIEHIERTTGRPVRKAAPGQPADLTKPKPEAAALDPNVAALVEALKSNVTQPKAETPPQDPGQTGHYPKPFQRPPRVPPGTAHALPLGRALALS